MQRALEELLAARSGHFVYESGHHGEIWLDLERLGLDPDRLRPFATALAERLRPYDVQLVCGPLVEGAFVGLLCALELGVRFTYSTPAAYSIPSVLHHDLLGKRVAIVDDVINAGSAVRGTLDSLNRCGACPVVIGTLAVYGEAATSLAAEHALQLETLATFPSQIWEPSDCPLCAKDGSPAS